MDGLKLLAKCKDAARKYSKTKSVDVLVVCEAGTEFLFVNGDEPDLPWLGGSMPARQHGAQVAYTDFRPVQIQLGQWSDAVGKFIPSRSMTPDEFLTLTNSN